MLVRPRDTCTAAFENDVERLRLLVTDGVLGGYHGFKESSWMTKKKAAMSGQQEQFQKTISTEDSKVERSNKDDDENSTHDQSKSTSAQHHNTPDRKADDDNNDDNDDNDEDDSEEEMELDDEDEAKLDNDVEYTRVLRQYAIDDSNSDDDNDNDNENSDSELDMVGDERENEYRDEEAANSNINRQSKMHVRYDKEREMARQERDMRRYRALIRNKLRQTEIAAKLNEHDVIYYTSVMNVPSAHVEDRTPYGFFCTIHEELEFPQQLDNKPVNTHDSARVGADACTFGNNTIVDKLHEIVHPQRNAEEVESLQLKLRVNWKPSKRSRFIASPLHWAVLGRAHEAIKYLVAHGANVDDEVTFAENSHKKITSTITTTTTTTAKDTKEPEHQHYFSKNHTTKMDMHNALAKHSGLTAAKVAKDNRSHHTYTVLQKAIANREREEQLELLLRQWLESKMERRKAQKEKHKLERDQRRVAREDAMELRERRAQELEEQYQEEEFEEDEKTQSVINGNNDNSDDDNEDGEDAGNM